MLTGNLGTVCGSIAGEALLPVRRATPLVARWLAGEYMSQRRRDVSLSMAAQPAVSAFVGGSRLRSAIGLSARGGRPDVIAMSSRDFTDAETTIGGLEWISTRSCGAVPRGDTPNILALIQPAIN